MITSSRLILEATDWEVVRHDLFALLLPEIRTDKAFWSGFDRAKGLEWSNFFFRPLEKNGLLSQIDIERGMARVQDNQGTIEALMDHRVELLGGYAPQSLGNPIDWFYMPGGDAQWPTHLSRHYWLAPLAFAWRATGNPAYPEKIASILIDWIEKTPFPSSALEHKINEWPRRYATAGSAPKHGEGYFPDYADGPWTALSAHTRVEWWTKLFQLTGRSPVFTNDIVGRLLLSLMKDHRQIMLDFPRQMNQFQAIAASLVDLGFFYPQFSTAIDTKLEGWRRLQFYGEQEIYPDGSMAECSPNYGLMCIERMHDMVERTQRAGQGVPPALRERIRRAVRYYAFTSDPSGCSPRLAKGGDLILGRLSQLNESWNDQEIAFVSSQGSAGIAPTETCFSFDWAGHQVFRSGWDKDAVWLFFDSGPRGSGHHDQAQLSIQLRAAGECLLTDPGYHTYSNGPAGRYSRYLHSTAAHSTAMIDGGGQVSFAPGTLRGPNTFPSNYNWINDAKIAQAEGTYTLGFGKDGATRVTHRRRIIFQKKELTFELKDTFEGKGGHEIWLHWQAPPGAKVELDSAGFRIRGKRAALHVDLSGADFTLKAVRGAEKPILGWYSETYGQLEEATTIRVAWRGDLPHCFQSLLRIELLDQSDASNTSSECDASLRK